MPYNIQKNETEQMSKGWNKYKDMDYLKNSNESRYSQFG